MHVCDNATQLMFSCCTTCIIVNTQHTVVHEVPVLPRCAMHTGQLSRTDGGISCPHAPLRARLSNGRRSHVRPNVSVHHTAEQMTLTIA